MATVVSVLAILGFTCVLMSLCVANSRARKNCKEITDRLERSDACLNSLEKKIS